MGWFSCGVGGKSQNSIASWVTVVICFLAKWSGFWGDSVEGPRPDLELSVAVAAGGDDTAVGAEPHGVDRARRDGHDVAPMAHIARRPRERTFAARTAFSCKPLRSGGSHL